MDGKTRVCGLIANPVEHSMSPMMHNFFAQRTGVNLAYVPFKVEEDRVGDAVKGAYALNILGMNVTVPHKQRVMDFLSELDEDARAIGAVNTLVRTDEGYKGYNTDGAGFSRALAKAGIRIEGEHCLLMGAGGAAKAAAYVLAKGGAAKIHILNRNEARARELAGYINTLTGSGLAEALPLEGYRNLPVRKNGYLAVQSTSVGMHPHVEDVIIDNPRFYEMIHTGVDIVYTPARTRFMKMVEEAGGRAVNGLDMLIYQGVIAYAAAYEYAEVEDMLKAAEEKGEPPFLILLDGIEDPHNLGAIIRTANLAGAHGVIIPKRRAAGLTATVAKTSAGALNYTPVAKVTNLTAAMEDLKKKGMWFVCADMGGDIMYKVNLKGPIGLVVGNEGEGVGKLVREHCDMTASIPMKGDIDSLNASVAAGVLAYEIVRQRMMP